MNFKDYVPIVLGVLKDFRVIATTISMILIISFAVYIKNYTKKPKVEKKKVKAVKKPEPKPASEEGAATEEKKDEGDKDDEK